MANNNFVPQIDYTSKDYMSIRNDLINLIDNYLPEWTSRDASDFGIVLIELFSYMGDILNFYIDRSANEAFISTASRRDTVLQLASLLSYKPTAATAATVTLTFTNSNTSSVTIPKGTQVSTSTSNTGSYSQVTFETDKEVIAPAKVGSTPGVITVTATQGKTIPAPESLGVSDGTAGQDFVLKNSPVLPSSISVTVGSKTYSRVDYLIDYSTGDSVFSTYQDSEGFTHVVFGDDVSGKIPPSNTEVFASYRVGGGSEGNVPKNSISYLNTLLPGISVSNQDAAAEGGSDSESVDSIRVNAPLSMKAVNRAVSVADYSSLAVQVDGVEKANARADVFTSITVYLKPYGSRGVEDDGVTPTDTFNTVADSVLSFLLNKAPANTSVSFQPPTYVPIDIILNVTAGAKNIQSKVKTEVGNIITELLKSDNVIFEDTITYQDLYTVLQSVEGVAKSSIVLMQRQSDVVASSVSNKAASGVAATITTSSAHSFKVGDRVYIGGVGTEFDGEHIVASTPSTTTFTYELISAVVASTAVSPSGSAKKMVVTDIDCAVNEIPELGVLTLNITGGVVA